MQKVINDIVMVWRSFNCKFRVVNLLETWNDKYSCKNSLLVIAKWGKLLGTRMGLTLGGDDMYERSFKF